MEPTLEFDREFVTAIKAWREERGLRDDDPILLCVELFRLHQRHWDAIRRADLPPFQQFRDDIAKLTEASSSFRREAGVLIELLHGKVAPSYPGVAPSLVIFSVSLALLAGFLLGGILL